MRTTALLVASFAAPVVAQPPSLQTFQPPAGTSPFSVLGLSGDGRFVCGQAGLHAFRWSTAAGFQLLEPTVGAGEGYRGESVANTGAAAGWERFMTTGGGQPYLQTLGAAWAPNGSWTEFFAPHPASNGYQGSAAHGISHSGNVIVGEAYDDMQIVVRPIIWTPGPTYLLALPNDAGGSVAAVSGDGTILVGSASPRNQGSTPPQHACRWTLQGEIIPLPALPGDLNSRATAASYDGSVIVGYSAATVLSPGTAVRWINASPAALPPPTGVTSATPTGVSGDGSIIVGDAGTTPVIWTAAGVQDLREFFIEQGLDMTGWSLTHIAGISRDGATFAGSGTLNGSASAWVVTLSACYANCDGSSTPPVLNIIDFACFLNAFATQNPYANCDHSSTSPTLNVNDFICFLNRFAQGCP